VLAHLARTQTATLRLTATGKGLSAVTQTADLRLRR
jgi:hypothetical protein